MISLDLARRLHAAGLAWSPASGDRFWLPERDLDRTVFTVSDMVVEVHEAVWLPRLDELLEALGTRFLSLAARSGGQVVRAQVGHRQEEYVDVGATDAAARAVLGVLQRGAQA